MSRYVDPERNLTRAKELFDKYKVVTDESVLIVDYEGRNKTVKASEMADMDQGNPMLGEPPQGDGLQGRTGDHERADRRRRGQEKHHRLHPRTQGTAARAARARFRSLKTFIENENIKFQELNLFEVPAIPADVKVVMIDGPQYDFSDREMKMLRDFWNKDGRILLLARSGREDAEAARLSQRARRESGRRSPHGDGQDRHRGSGASARCDGAFLAR